MNGLEVLSMCRTQCMFRNSASLCPDWLAPQLFGALVMMSCLYVVRPVRDGSLDESELQLKNKAPNLAFQDSAAVEFCVNLQLSRS